MLPDIKVQGQAKRLDDGDIIIMIVGWNKRSGIWYCPYRLAEKRNKNAV